MAPLIWTQAEEEAFDKAAKANGCDCSAPITRYDNALGWITTPAHLCAFHDLHSRLKDRLLARRRAVDWLSKSEYVGVYDPEDEC